MDEMIQNIVADLTQEQVRLVEESLALMDADGQKCNRPLVMIAYEETREND